MKLFSYLWLQEAHTNIINIEFDAETVKNMVAFMYGEDYDDSAEKSEVKNGVDNEKAKEEIGDAGSTLLLSLQHSSH
jgi:hypothetical protein